MADNSKATEHSFYAAVAAACEAAGIPADRRAFVEMTCTDNADVPSRFWEMATDTLDYIVDTGQIEAASQNKL